MFFRSKIGTIWANEEEGIFNKIFNNIFNKKKMKKKKKIERFLKKKEQKSNNTTQTCCVIIYPSLLIGLSLFLWFNFCFGNKCCVIINSSLLSPLQVNTQFHMEKNTPPRFLWDSHIKHDQNPFARLLRHINFYQSRILPQ